MRDCAVDARVIEVAGVSCKQRSVVNSACGASWNKGNAEVDKRANGIGRCGVKRRSRHDR